MRECSRILTAGFAAFMVAGSASAATLIATIDDYNGGDQRVADAPDLVPTNASQVAYGNAIGGYRDMAVSNDQGSADATELRVSNGALQFSNISLASGTGIITYDGDDDPNVLDPFGLGGVDLQVGSLSQNYFLFDVIDADGNIDVTVDAFDMSGGQSTYFETLSPGLGFSPFLFYNEFVGNADFNDIGALRFTVASTNGIIDRDGAIDEIGAYYVPVPASGILMIGGLGGLLACRRMRRSRVAQA